MSSKTIWVKDCSCDGDTACEQYAKDGKTFVEYYCVYCDKPFKKEQRDDKIIEALNEIPQLYHEVTTSDLQGILEAKAYDLNKENKDEITEIMLEYAYDKIRFELAYIQILDMVEQ